MIEFAGDALADRSEILRDKDRLIVLRQVMQTEKTFLARGDSPPDEDVAKPNKEHDVHQVLDGERIKEMLRRFVENEHSRASGKNERKKCNKENAETGEEQ